MSTVNEMTHKELVKLGVSYLQSAKQCNPVFVECGSAKISEMPDIIGWNSKDCIVIECKVSQGDLIADFKKSFRGDGKGLGSRRYYLLTEEICNDEIYSRITKFGWGILVAFESRIGVRQIRRHDSITFKSNLKAERDFLRSRILQIQRFGR